MKSKFIFIALLFFITSKYFPQKNKSFGIGLSTPFSYPSRIPGLSLTPNINYFVAKHRFQIGIDIYTFKDKNTPNILGIYAGYNYLFRDEKMKFNYFIDLNFQTVNYGVGTRLPVPYNYLPTDTYKKDYNLIRTKSFINTIGLGLNFSLFKRATFIIVLGGGYNYYNSECSPTNTNKMGIYNFETGKKTIPIGYGRLGLNFKLWKNY